MATPTFDATRFYQFAQVPDGTIYILQDGNWYNSTTLASLAAAIGNYKLMPYPGLSSAATKPPQPIVAAIFQTGLPLIVMPTSSNVSAAGILTSGTALPIITGSCYCYLPANYLATVSAAGWYYGTITDSTHIQLFNNTYSGTGVPAIPAATTAFAGLTGGTPTGSTGAKTVTCVVPANTMGLNGEVEVMLLATYNSSGSNKIVSVAFGSLAGPTTTATTTTSLGYQWRVRNSGATNVQICPLTVDEAYTTATQVLGYGAVDTTGAVNLVVTLNNALAADFLILNALSVKVYPA